MNRSHLRNVAIFGTIFLSLTGCQSPYYARIAERNKLIEPTYSRYAEHFKHEEKRKIISEQYTLLIK